MKKLTVLYQIPNELGSVTYATNCGKTDNQLTGISFKSQSNHGCIFLYCDILPVISASLFIYIYIF